MSHRTTTRRSQRAAFAAEPGAPAPLTATAARRVRFEEVDPLGIVWHGRYPSYFEDGRAAFGERYDLGYDDMRANNFACPIVQMHVEYHAPLSFPDDFTITATLHYSDAVRLNFSYTLASPAGAVLATGYTVQLVLDLASRQVLLVRPDYLERFWQRWRAGELR